MKHDAQFRTSMMRTLKTEDTSTTSCITHYGAPGIMMLPPMRSFFIIICCQLVGFATSFQQGQLLVHHSTSTFAFSRTSTDFRHKYYPHQEYTSHPATYLLGGKGDNHRDTSLSAWNAKYEELAEFHKKHGHLNVEYRGQLYDWMIIQRRKRKGMKGCAPLVDDQIRLLDEIGFPWDPYESTWCQKYEELAEFYGKHGHYRVEHHGSLHMWMITQRRKRKGMKGYAPLTDEQIQLLDRIDFPWNPVPYQSKWYLKYEELAEFYKKHGHLRVEYRGILYKWMICQRRKRSGMKGYAPLADEQIRLLDEIGFSWDPNRHEYKWHSKYQELAEFYMKYGHHRVAYNGSLHKWIATQRRKRNGTKRYASLTDEQIHLLNDINFPWNSDKRGCPTGLNDRRWIIKYQELSEFYKKHGDYRVEYRSGLYQWIIIQRRKRNGMERYAPLTDEQIQLLDKIDFPWNPVPYQSKWYLKYEELAELYKKHGHYKVKYRGDLYQWMGIQRRKRKGMKGYAPLADEQIQLLNEINFPWNPKRGKPRSTV